MPPLLENLTLSRLVSILIVPLFLFGALYLWRTPANEIAQLPAPVYQQDTLSTEPSPLRTAVFQDMTLTAGIFQPHIQRSDQLSGLHESLGGAACAFDANGDGWIDLLTLNGSGTTHFFWQTQMVATE